MELYEQAYQIWCDHPQPAGPSFKVAAEFLTNAERERCLRCVSQVEKASGRTDSELRRLINSGADPAAKEPGQVLCEASGWPWNSMATTDKKAYAEREAAVRAHYCPQAKET